MTSLGLRGCRMAAALLFLGMLTFAVELRDGSHQWAQSLQRFNRLTTPSRQMLIESPHRVVLSDQPPVVHR